MKLSEITSPADIKSFSEEELETLAEEIREKIISTVAVNGGHLASNLGAVELTIALHRAFDCPKDKIIFDVGHQCYAHKLLTGRYDAFSTLRTMDGLCGFPRRQESPYDTFDTGHASTAISAALGMARARDIMGAHYKVAAVVGDGALTGGMAYEALDDVGQQQLPLIDALQLPPLPHLSRDGRKRPAIFRTARWRRRPVPAWKACSTGDWGCGRRTPPPACR